MWILVEVPTKVELASVAFPIAEGMTTVGRDEGCEIVLGAAGVSRRHLSLCRRGDSIEFEDLGSSAGTRLNGTECGAGRLSPGDVLTIGSLELHLVAAPPKASLSRTSRPRIETGFSWEPFRALLDGLRRSSEPKELLEKLLEGLLKVTGAERGFVILTPEGESHRLVPVVSRCITEQEAVQTFSGTLCRQVLTSGRMVCVADSSQDESLRSAPSMIPMKAPRAIMCGPLVSAGQIHGVIYVDRPACGAVIDELMVQIFETMTGLASELLTGARVRESLLKAEARIRILDEAADSAHSMVMGSGKASEELERLLELAAPTDVSVLITGETGTGKEVVARRLHQKSARGKGPFVPVNCAALPRDVIEAELFGAEKGAYTGATERRPGRFELASGGTLFLDEVAEIPLELQVKLLRVIEERSVVRVGGTETLTLDFRLICATNMDVEAAVADGSFRQDLFYRINVFRLRLLPLRERPDDILPLAEHFLSDFAKSFGRTIDGFSDEARAVLLTHQWPGNVRELRNAIERAVVVESGSLVSAHSLPIGAAPVSLNAEGGRSADWQTTFPQSYEEARDDFERAFLEHSLAAAKGRVAEAARTTGMTRQAIYRRLEKLGILPQE